MNIRGWIHNNIKVNIYKIYIWIGTKLGIKLLPLQIDFKSIDFYYKGDTIIWMFKKKYWISSLFSGTGEFGDAIFYSLKEIDRAWDEYFKAIKEKSNCEFKYE